MLVCVVLFIAVVMTFHRCRFASQMGEGVIPEGFKNQVTEMIKEVMQQARLNTKILNECLASPVVEEHLQEASGTVSHKREVRRTNLHTETLQ